jgi:hypothetical protein
VRGTERNQRVGANELVKHDTERVEAQGAAGQAQRKQTGAMSLCMGRSRDQCEAIVVPGRPDGKNIDHGKDVEV